jgi:hypothetical protein
MLGTRAANLIETRIKNGGFPVLNLRPHGSENSDGAEMRALLPRLQRLKRSTSADVRNDRLPRVLTMAMQGNQPVTLIPAQRATLLVGERQIPVDDWPLAHIVNEKRSVDVVGSDDLLVIEPKRRSVAGRIVVVAVLVLSASAFPSLVVALCGLPIWMALPIIVATLALIGMLVRNDLASMKWITFDRRAGQLIFERRVGFRNLRHVECTYPLETIRAVQLLHNGRRSVSETVGAGEQQWISHREFDGYELNLVIDDRAVPRVNLASLSDWQWIRETGNRIADFVGVPVVDKLYHGG